jgi:hypothetical protein
MRRNKDIRVGDSVVLLRDIYRVPNPKNAEEGAKFAELRLNYWADCSTYHRLNGDIYLKHTCAPYCCNHQLYAEEGEKGEVVGFAPRVPAIRTSLQPQVRMADGEIKTFRLTSLERISV